MYRTLSRRKSNFEREPGPMETICHWGSHDFEPDYKTISEEEYQRLCATAVRLERDE